MVPDILYLGMVEPVVESDGLGLAAPASGHGRVSLGGQGGQQGQGEKKHGFHISSVLLPSSFCFGRPARFRAPGSPYASCLDNWISRIRTAKDWEEFSRSVHAASGSRGWKKHGKCVLRELNFKPHTRGDTAAASRPGLASGRYGGNAVKHESGTRGSLSKPVRAPAFTSGTALRQAHAAALRSLHRRTPAFLAVAGTLCQRGQHLLGRNGQNPGGLLAAGVGARREHEPGRADPGLRRQASQASLSGGHAKSRPGGRRRAASAQAYQPRSRHHRGSRPDSRRQAGL